MNKKAWLIALACVLLLGVAAFAGKSFIGKKPFKDLEAANIAHAAVRLTPPDKTIQIVDINELAEYLGDVVIYNEDNSYTEYSGQGVTFTLTMTDGTETSVMAYNPFLVINGVGYKTKYEPCQALSGYANRLLNEEGARIISATGY